VPSSLLAQVVIGAIATRLRTVRPGANAIGSKSLLYFTELYLQVTLLGHTVADC
jgi:hypothetical protein